MRDCMGGDASKQRFEECARSIVKDDGGDVLGVWFESSTRFAHIHVQWPDLETKGAILYDLEAVDTGDLLSAEEADDLSREREAAT
jgi:hypothetical protein